MSNTIITAESASAATALANKARLANKNRWLFLEILVNNQPPLLVKSFNTSIQILRKKGVNHPCGMDMKITAWKNAINDALEYQD